MRSSCLQASFGRAAYHHEMVIQLRKDRLNSLSETLVGPCGWRPILLIQPVRDNKGNVGSLKYVLRCAIAPGWRMLYIISHLAPVGTCVLAYLDRLGIDAEDILASVDSLSNGLTDAFSKQHRLLAALIVLPTGNQVGNGSGTL